MLTGVFPRTAVLTVVFAVVFTTISSATVEAVICGGKKWGKELGRLRKGNV